MKLLGPRMALPLNGAWYPVKPLADWLNGPQLYHLPFTAWFAYYGLRTALLRWRWRIIAWRMRHMVDREHIRGLRLLAPREHNRQVHGGWLERFRKPRWPQAGREHHSASKNRAFSHYRHARRGQIDADPAHAEAD